jgi:hypothetical protein
MLLRNLLTSLFFAACRLFCAPKTPNLFVFSHFPPLYKKQGGYFQARPLDRSRFDSLPPPPLGRFRHPVSRLSLTRAAKPFAICIY